MKQYTNESQTVKLIELGFAPKAKIKEVRVVHSKVKVDHDCNFTVGELIEILPDAICESHDDSCHYHLSMDTDACMWRVRYIDDFDVTLCTTYDVDLINALYDMCVKLKEEGVI